MLPPPWTYAVDVKYLRDGMLMLGCQDIPGACVKEDIHISEHYYPWLIDYQSPLSIKYHLKIYSSSKYILFSARHQTLIGALQHLQTHKPWLTCSFQTASRIASLYQYLCPNAHSIRSALDYHPFLDLTTFFFPQLPPNITKNFQFISPQNHLSPGVSPRVKASQNSGFTSLSSSLIC